MTFTAAWRTRAAAVAAALGLIASLTAVTQPASAAPPAAGTLKINEVESSGGTPGDWVELVNTGSAAADVGGYQFLDNDNTHTPYAIPAGTSIPAGGYLVLDEAQFGFGLGSADSARIFAPGTAPGGTPEDSYSWTAHAATTYGRCPDATGTFVTTTSSTKGAANDCPGPNFKINEVESSGGTPGDWVEIINTGNAAGDLGGYTFLDNDNTHTPYTIPAGTNVAAGGRVVLDEAQFVFGLGSADSARLFTPGGALADSYSWTAHATTTYGRCPDGTGAFTTTGSPTKGTANDCGAAAPSVKINEVESNGGTPGDWIELINNGATTADLSGYVVKDDDDTHVYTLPAGTTVPAGGYYVADESALGFALGSADAARLFAPGGTTLIDSYTWTAHAVNTYGRCPNGTGAFAETSGSTKGVANLCPGDIPVEPWPGGSAVSIADDSNVFGTNLSGLAYQPSGTTAPGVLWAVRNGPSTLYRLLWDGTKWTPDTANGWSAGKQLRYPDGTGDPDAEGVTLVDADPAGGIFVSTERNNQANTISRPAVLRFDASAAGTTLVATNDWNLTADLPPLGPNLGLEAVTWISDAFLQSKGFKDETTSAPYNPAAYPGHGTGLFFVGVEQNGNIYAYALNQSTGAFTRVATITSGFPSVMELQFEPETTHLWAVCDDTCNGRSATLDIAQSGAGAGRFAITHVYERPTGMPNFNNEGFAIAPQDECVAGSKPVFWSDDTNDGGHALRAGTLPCTVIVRPQTITFAQPAAMTFGGPSAALSATASSGLPVSLAASGPCAVTGTAAAPTLTATGAGTCTVTASQAGNANFLAAPSVVRTVTIAKAPTRLQQTPVSLVNSTLNAKVTYAAVLTSTVTGQPLAGRSISFGPASGARRATCTATTNAAGRATCTARVIGFASVVLRGGTTARFAGSADYLPSTSTVRPVEG